MSFRLFVSMTFLLLTARTAFAFESYTCSCLAKRPGYESGANIDKICDYSCQCTGSTQNQDPKIVEVSVDETKSTAKSFEMWDFGSHICHGQYAYRATLSSPNWQIQVKFSPFQITSTGSMIYEELVEISSGVKSTLRRTKTAPEIQEVLDRQLLNGLPH